MCKLRERFGLLEQINSDLTYAVAVNLAEAYHAAQLYSEALNSFTQIVRSKQFPQVSIWTVGDDAAIGQLRDLTCIATTLHKCMVRICLQVSTLASKLPVHVGSCALCASKAIGNKRCLF